MPRLSSLLLSSLVVSLFAGWLSVPSAARGSSAEALRVDGSSLAPAAGIPPSPTGSDSDTRAAAVTAPGDPRKTDREVDERVRALDDADPEVRRAAVCALASGELDATVVVPALARALEDRDAQVRTAAAAALSRLDHGVASACPALITALEDPHDRVRMHAVTALGKIGPAALPAVPAILPLLEAEESPVRQAAARALVGMGDRAIPFLVRALQTADPDRRSPLEAALARHGRAALDHLQPFLLSRQSRRRDLALSILLRMAPAAKALVPTLIAGLRSRDTVGQVRTARVLGRIGPPAVSALVRTLETERGRTRRLAALALTYAASEHGAAVSGAESAFLDLLESENAEVARLGATGLVDLGLDPAVAFPKVRDVLAAQEALPLALTAAVRPDQSREEAARAIAPFLGRSRPGYRLLAALALARLGMDAAPVIHRALESDQERIRLGAAWALALGDHRAILPAIERCYGVEVMDRVTRNFFPRDLWPRTHARSLPRAARGPALALLIRALARYPTRLVRRHLAGIRLAQSLAIDGLPYGGTLHQGQLYLATGPTPNESMVRAFHHEFSSALFRSSPFPETEWVACNPASFHYGQGGRHAIRIGSVGFGNVALFARGFFTPYACADLENDFNVFSETVLSEPIRARTLIDRHARLNAKWQVWIRFYGEQDASFTTDRILHL